MSVNAIYASKLFKASKRKDKIRAAAENPLNAELVIQIPDYVDDEFKVSSKSKSAETSSSPDTDDKDSKERIRPSESHASSGGGGHFAPSGGADHHLSDMLKDEEGPAPDFEKSSEASESPEPASSENDSSEGVEESTNITQPSITACTEISTEIDSIIGLLNSREDTAGVCRGLVKEDELWLHFKDSINLNNVMEPVIALLNASNYTTLNFNRLARTENAIVFSICETVKPVASIQDIQEGVDEEK